jgi:hypothetical protein
MLLHYHRLKYRIVIYSSFICTDSEWVRFRDFQTCTAKKTYNGDLFDDLILCQERLFMRTTVIIDDELFAQAVELIGFHEKTALLGGSEPDLDHTERWKSGLIE